MISDSIRNIDLYKNIHKDFPKVFEYMKTLGKDSLKGPFVLDGDNVHGSVWTIETKGTPSRRRLEKHEKFIDIHYILDGSEKFGYADASTLTPICDYNSEDDYIFLKGKATGIVLTPGHFCIVFPDDAHSPYCINGKSETVKRCVIKVRVSD